AWPAFIVGCRALLASPKTQPLWQTPCAESAHIDGAKANARRAFLKTHFTPYRIAAADGNDVGLVTGYYEPLLEGSRTSTPRFTVPLYAPPDDLLTIDIAALYPELKDKRVRGRVVGRKVVPYWSRAELESGSPSLAGK